MANTLRNLDWKDGQTNASGIRPIAYYVLKASIKKFPTLAEGSVTYQGDFELADGETFKTIYTTQGKGKVSYEALGEKDCRMFTNKAALSYPDINDESGVFAAGTVNSNIIFAVPHYVAGGKIRFAVIGGESFDTTIDVKGDSGDAPGSAKATSIELSAPDFVPLPSYTGIIETDSGSLDCDTGVFTPSANP